MRPILIAAALLTLGGCQKQEALTVTGTWIRLAATAAAPAAGYFELHGGRTADRLISVTSDNVIRIELHETLRGGGATMSMRPLTSVDVPAGGTVKFEPGGKHLMLFGVNPAIQPPRTLRLMLTFASGERLEADAPVNAPGTVK